MANKPGPKLGTVNNPKGINQYSSSGPKTRSAVQTSARSAFFNKELDKAKELSARSPIRQKEQRLISKVFTQQTMNEAKAHPKFLPFIRETGSDITASIGTSPGGMSLKGVSKKDLYKSLDTIVESQQNRPLAKGPENRPGPARKKYMSRHWHSDKVDIDVKYDTDTRVLRKTFTPKKK
jgi:hypothetical protein